MVIKQPAEPEKMFVAGRFAHIHDVDNLLCHTCLIGIPVRITVGKLAPEGKVEYKLRREADRQEMTVEEAIKAAIDIVNKEKRG